MTLTSSSTSLVPMEFKEWIRVWGADCDDEAQSYLIAQILCDFRLAGRYSAVEVQELLIQDEACEHLINAFDELVNLFDTYLEVA